MSDQQAAQLKDLLRTIKHGETSAAVLKSIELMAIHSLEKDVAELKARIAELEQALAKSKDECEQLRSVVAVTPAEVSEVVRHQFGE